MASGNAGGGKLVLKVAERLYLMGAGIYKMSNVSELIE
jgi:hypothetical protein